MVKQVVRRIAIATALVTAWCVAVGFMSGSAAGAATGAVQGLVISAAAAIAIALRTLAGRGPLSRSHPALTQPDSVERQIFVAASSEAFVDTMRLSLAAAVLVIVYPGLVPAAPLLIGVAVASLVDFGIRYGFKRRSLVGAR